MITFPAWVESPHDPELTQDDIAAQLAQRRLRFMILTAALHGTCHNTISALAENCDVTREHLHAAIREGRCSPKIAAKIERLCGRNVLRREWLMFPLEIEELAL